MSDSFLSKLRQQNHRGSEDFSQLIAHVASRTPMEATEQPGETPKSAAVAIASALIQARVRQPNGGDDDDDDDDNDGIFVAPSTTSSRRASNSSNASTTNTGATSTHVHGSSSNSHQSSASASSSLSSMSPRPLSSSHALSLSSTSSLSNSSSQSHLSDIANRQSRSNSGNTSHISHSHHSSNDPFSLPSGPRSQSNSFSMEFALSSSTPLPQFHRLQLSSPSSTSSNSSLHSFFPPGTNSPGLGSGRQSPSTSFSVASSFSPSASTGTPSPSLPHSSHLPALPSPSSYSSSSSSSSSPFASNSLLAAASPSFSPSSSLSPYPPLPPPSSSSSSSAASASSSSTSSFVSPFAQSPSPSAAKIADWASLNHVELIHRQGLQAPPIVFQITEDPTDEANRMFYQLFLPQANPEQQESSLCCRKKSKENKFRFSLDAIKMTKRDNPGYVGKMKCNDAFDTFTVTLASGVHLAEIRLRDKRNITCEIVNQYLNVQETGKGGRLLSGTIQSYLQPMLSLSVESSSRPVLCVYNPIDSPAQAAERRLKFIVEFDYPLTVFLAFAVVCAVESAKTEQML